MNTTESKLGVALIKCFFCGNDKGIIMNQRLTVRDAQKIEECNGKVVDLEPCDTCKEYMKQGIIFISVKDGSSGMNPYRTGGFVVLKDEGVKKCVAPEMYEQVKKTRFAFIDDSTWDALGLPRK